MLKYFFVWRAKGKHFHNISFDQAKFDRITTTKYIGKSFHVSSFTNIFIYVYVWDDSV